MTPREFNNRVQKMLSISEKAVKNKDLDLFFKKTQKLTKHYDFTKGIYSGEPNFSQLVIYLVEKDFEYIFGNSNLSDLNTSPNELFDLEQIRTIFKGIKKNVRRYSKEQLFVSMRNTCLELAKSLEMEFRRRTHDANK